jgi:DNA-binding response OmpR family regulator
MVTASGEQEKLAAIEAGADDLIAKPFDQSELLARVRSLLRLKDTTTRSSRRPPS